MSDSIIYIVAFVGLGILFVFTCVKSASEGERVAVYVFGRFHGLKGPGLLVRFPGQAAEWFRLRLGDRGEMLGPDVARFGNRDVPVGADSRIRLGTLVRIAGFDDNRVRVESDPDQSRTYRCPACGHEFSP